MKLGKKPKLLTGPIEEEDYYESDPAQAPMINPSPPQAPGINTNIMSASAPYSPYDPVPGPTEVETEIIERLDRLEKMLISLQEDILMALVEKTNP